MRRAFADAITFLCRDVGVSAITGDCGFMMYFQEEARRLTTCPIMMSSLAQLPSVTCSFCEHEKIAIFTANGTSLEPMHALIKKWCAVDPDEERYIIVVRLGGVVGRVRHVERWLAVDPCYCRLKACTANLVILKPLSPVIIRVLNLLLFRVELVHFYVVGCEDVPGFEAIAAGDKVDVAMVVGQAPCYTG